MKSRSEMEMYVGFMETSRKANAERRKYNVRIY